MRREKCLNKELNEKDCPCEYTNCERRGICCLCIRHHKDAGDKPACSK